MKIRLAITSPSGKSRTVERSGPAVRIGRDPECELPLDEDEQHSASRQHACIELTARGASLRDLGSSNRTLHNDQEVTAPTPLRPGDRIQIGYTGTTFVVLSIDLTPERHAVSRRALLLGGGAVAAGVLVVAFLLLPGRKTPPPLPEPDKRITAVASTPVIVPISTPPQLKTPPPVMSGLEVKKVGHYLRPPKARPSVLLRRGGENDPWYVVRSGEEIRTSQSLVSLPGYESQLYLDRGVRLNLWGNLPEFIALPLRECVVMLTVPPQGVDVELILDRGRIELEGIQLAGSRTVRLRVLREVWDVVLADPGSKVCVDVWHHDTPSATGPVIGLFSQGKVVVKTSRETVSFKSPGRVAWVGWRADQLLRQNLSAPPDWWTNAPKPSAEVSSAALFLQDWAVKRLDTATAVVDTFRAVVQDSSNEPKDRMLGLLFLAAIDEAAPLVAWGLNDQSKDNGMIRGTALLALQDWLARNEGRRASLARQLQKQGYSGPKATLIVGLLRPAFTRSSATTTIPPELITHLDHEDVPVRHLAAYHLYVSLKDALPAEVHKIEYDPMMEESKRQEAVRLWRAAVAARGTR